MAFREEVRIVRKYKTKKSIDSLAQQLAEIIFPDCEAKVDDLLERLITFEAGRYNLLPENEMQALKIRKDYQDYINPQFVPHVPSFEQPTIKQAIPIEDKIVKQRQEIKTLLPLGAVRTD